MSKKFRCGRLLLTKHGRIKKLDLGNGGGTRTCECLTDHMTFDDVHNQLLTVFSLMNNKHETSLYDFQHQPLDLKQFKTFTDYINRYGLNRNSTVVYLCTSERDEDIPRSIQIENNNSSVSVVNNEPDSTPEEIPTTHSKSSSSEYSFIDTSNDLMKNMRELINESPSDKVLIHLFEKICLIHGYVFSIIVPLQQSNKSEMILYLNNLNRIYDIFESTKSLLHQNIDNFRHLRLFSTIRSSFFQFYNNAKILRNRSNKNMEKNNKMDASSTSLTVSNVEPTIEDDHERNLIEPPSLSASEELLEKEKKEKTFLFKPVLDSFPRFLREPESVCLRGMIPNCPIALEFGLCA